MADEELLQFSHGEGENRSDRRLKRSQVTAERLSYMFEVISKTKIKAKSVVESLSLF